MLIQQRSILSLLSLNVLHTPVPKNTMKITSVVAITISLKVHNVLSFSLQRVCSNTIIAGGRSTYSIINKKSKTELFSETIDQHDQKLQKDDDESTNGNSSSANSGSGVIVQPSFHHQVPLTESVYTQILSTNSIAPIAELLRQSYDKHFKDPRQPNADRFIWDPWFVKVGDGLQLPSSSEEGSNNHSEQQAEETLHSAYVVEGEKSSTKSQIQYSLKRIQSSNFFTQNEFADLVENLTVLGRSIGCNAITPPWMSLYTNGDRQNFHTDAPQGQMAFVLSLCKDERDFDGGETMILRSEIMDYWKGFDGSKGLECGDIVRFIPPTPLGRCIIFDPRVPHGVSTVIGNNDPRNGRVVIHGWFNEPETCWFGPWGGGSNGNVEDMDIDDQGQIPTIQKANQILEESFPSLLQTIGSGEIGRVAGYLAIRLEIDEDGDVTEVLAVCDTLKADWDDYRGIIGFDEAERPIMEDAINDVRLTIYEAMKSLNFGEGEAGRAVVVPFAFQ